MDHLKLENQICFSLYAASRLVTKKYKHFLADMGITYPQYLVLLILWEKDALPITQIWEKMFLETNTLTPLIRRMETLGLVTRSRSKKDERVTLVQLTAKSKKFKQQASEIPKKLVCLVKPEHYSLKDLQNAKNILDDVIVHLQK